ncbi:unnamed protein product [Rhodiola kirilowii]
MSASWSDLPSDLLHHISLRLPTYTDFLRFRAVSHHFRSSTSSTPTHLPTQLPWLLLPHTHHAHPPSAAPSSISRSTNSTSSPA